MIDQSLHAIVQILPSTLVGWYFLFLMFFGLTTSIRTWLRAATCRRIHTVLTAECRAFCVDTGKCYVEFFLAASIALGACFFYGMHNSHYFMGQNLDFKDWQTHAFLASAAIMCTAPFYALMWGFISVLCPQGQDEDRHLFRFAGFVCKITGLALLLRNCMSFLGVLTRRNSFWINN